jgi:SPP1 gp7 family putative phage head morphogenesis protein
VRQGFEAEVKRRFRELMRRIQEEVVKEDGFGLVTNAGRFDFPRSADKVNAFMRWLNAAIGQGILEVIQGVPIAASASNAWTSTYVETAYQKGVAAASGNLRKGGVDVADRWISTAFNRPLHADRLGLIFTRTYDQLKGITDTMASQISRVLAQGLAEGRSPLDIARQMRDRVNRIGITRARVLARTEVINAHAEATLNTYTEAGIEDVEVEAEFLTAGDDRVCPQCEALEGNIYSIDDAHGIIPVHPNCRCAWRPVVPETARGAKLL